MREILFRAWDGKRYSIGNPKYFDDSVNFRFHHFDIDCEKPILEQFTGLTDKNGNKIFEGDKIKLTQGIGTVEWFKTQSRFMIWLPKSNEFVRFLAGIDYEVIGNIHDNPDLMKEKTK